MIPSVLAKNGKTNRQTPEQKTMIIKYRKLSQQTIIYLLAMIGICYQDYKNQRIAYYSNAQKLKRAYNTGLKYLNAENRFYFDCYSVTRPTNEIEKKAGAEAEAIFYGTF